MKQRFLSVLFLVCFAGISVHAQLNNYKYIIVPKKFEAFKRENQFLTSTLVKYLFAQNGFTPVYDDALPNDLTNNRCLGLLADLEDNSAMFSTKVALVLKDCQSNVVFKTIEGKTKIKDYNEAYKKALEQAFVSFDGIDYTYTPPQKKEAPVEPESIKVSFKDDVKHLDKKTDTAVVKQIATKENQSYESNVPEASNYTKAEAIVEKPMLTSKMLYAQATANGYQLVDSTPKVVMKLMATSMENVFLTEYEGNSGLVLQKEGKWFLEYSEGGEKKLKELHIKF